MSGHIANLIQDVKQAVGLKSVAEVRQLLSNATFAELFASQFQPLFVSDLHSDIPDLCEINDLLVLGLDNSADREDFLTAVVTIDCKDQQRFLATFTLMVRLVELIGTDGVEQQNTFFKAWVILKLAVSVWQYWLQNDSKPSWDDYKYLDECISEDGSSEGG